MGLLVECKKLEALAGRLPGKRWGPRPLDIDIISHNGRRIRTPWITLPHPRVMERPFALAPLSELAPKWAPRGSETIVNRLRILNPQAGAVRIYRAKAH